MKPITVTLRFDYAGDVSSALETIKKYTSGKPIELPYGLNPHCTFARMLTAIKWQLEDQMKESE